MVKKVLALLLAGLMLAGCAAQPSEAPADEPVAPVEETVQEEVGVPIMTSSL